MSDYITEIFSSNGYLEKSLGQMYESRNGQIQYARAVDDALSNRTNLLVEGPPGTGKSIGYLAPAIYHAAVNGRKTVIATSTINLQKQLFEEDAPILQGALPWKPKVRFLKGRRNYVCKRKVADWENYKRVGTFGVLGSDLNDNYGLIGEEGYRFRELMQWARTSDTGDKESSNRPITSNTLFAKISVGHDECDGRACINYDDCFYEDHRRNLSDANIYIINYHILFSHLRMLSQLGASGILPEFDNLILDEAHNIKRIAQEFFGFSISSYRVSKLGAFIERTVGCHSLVQRLKNAASGLLRSVDKSAFAGRSSEALIKNNLYSLDTLIDSISTLTNRIDAEGPGKVIHERLGSLRHDVEETFTQQLPGSVYYAEKKGRFLTIERRDLAVDELIRRDIFNDTKTVIATSATMTTGRSFASIKADFGLTSDINTKVVESPFDLVSKARLLIPPATHLVPTSQNRDRFNAHSVAIYQNIIDWWPNPLLLLFTSVKDMEFVFKQLNSRGRWMTHQNKGVRNDLITHLKSTRDGILLGVDSFGTGVDIPGSLGVVIHKLPFRRWGLMERATKEYLGPQRFETDHYIPGMVRVLRQWAGRLLRRKDDYGFVAILDGRITWGRYRDTIMASLGFDGWLRTDRLHDLDDWVKIQERNTE